MSSYGFIGGASTELARWPFPSSYASQYFCALRSEYGSPFFRRSALDRCRVGDWLFRPPLSGVFLGFLAPIFILCVARGSLYKCTPPISPLKANCTSCAFASSSSFEGGALVLATLARKHARKAPGFVDVVSRATRTALVAPLAIPWARDVATKVGTRNLAVVISVAAARPNLSSISHQLRQTIFEFWNADPTYLEGEDGPRRREV